MKKFTPTFFNSLLYNFAFWAVVLILYYIFRKAHFAWGIVFIIIISLIYALVVAVNEYYKKNHNKKGIHYTLGILGLINLGLCSSSIVLFVDYLGEHKYVLFILFLILSFVFYFRFDNLFHSNKAKKAK